MYKINPNFEFLTFFFLNSGIIEKQTRANRKVIEGQRIGQVTDGESC